MGSLFTEIIFPPIPKKEVVVETNDYRIDYWIVGDPPHKTLYVQCPVCYFSFRLATVLDEASLEKYIHDMPQVYFNAAIRDCPDKANHGKETWHQHLKKDGK